MPDQNDSPITYRVERVYEGLYYIFASDDDERYQRTASVGRWQPGPMVSVTGPQITPPALARAIAEAMIALSIELDSSASDAR